MKITSSILASLTAFFLPVQGVLIAVSIAILLEVLSNAYKAKKLKQPLIIKEVPSIIVKILVYDLMVVFLFIIDHFLLSEFFALWFSVEYFATKIVALVIVGMELTAIRANLEAATGKDIFKWLRSTLQYGKEIKNDVNDLIQ